MAGVLFTILKGIDSDPWGIGIFDLDFLTLLTGYLFLSFSPIQAGAFALGQGFLIDILSSGPNGLFALIYVSVFSAIYISSLFFNFQAVKGQIIIVSLTVFLKNVTLQALIVFFSGSIGFSASFLCGAAVSIIGTGLLAPVLYTIFDRLMGLPGEEDAPALEDLKDRTWENDYH